MRTRLALVAVLCAAVVPIFIIDATPVGAANSVTWSGNSTTTLSWSDATNWQASAVPSGTASLDFPDIGSTCTTAYATSHACFISNNDLTNLAPNSLTIAAPTSTESTATGYSIVGDGFTLGSGGLQSTETVPDGATGCFASGLNTIGVPVVIGGSQTWNVTGKGPVLYGGMSGGVRGQGATNALTVNLTHLSEPNCTTDLNGMALAGNMQVGNVTLNGDASLPIVYVVPNGTSGSLIPANLNGTDGNLVTANGVFLVVEGTTGPLATHVAVLNVGGLPASGTPPPGSGQVNVNGSVTLDNTTELLFPNMYSGQTVGTTYPQLESTGPIALNDATLSLNASCSASFGNGQLLTLVQGASVSGELALSPSQPIPNGSVVPISPCGSGGPSYGLKINYTATQVLGTITSLLASKMAITVPATANEGTAVTYQANVESSTGAGGTPSGTVTFMTGSTTLCTATLDSSGQGTCQGTNAPPGTEEVVTGLYSGDNKFGTSEAAGLITVTPVPTSVSAASGTPQSTTVLSPFPQDLVVLVTDALGNPMPGVQVSFSAPSSGASGVFENLTNQITATSDASGLAAVPFGANETVGSYVVMASIAGISQAATFSLTNLPGPASSITVTSGSGQSAAVNSAFESPLSVTVTDAFGDPVAGATVTFSAPSSGASGYFADSGIQTTTAVTNAQGVASSASFTANADVGSYTVTAGVPGASGAATFTLTNTLGIAPPIGYWLVGADGGIFSYGARGFYGSTGNLVLNKPIVDMVPTPDRKGYWMVASDGGVFAFGDAHFYGSTGSLTLFKPIVGMAATADGRGYWLVAADGGIFAFGDAKYLGSTGGHVLNQPIVGMVPTNDARGYTLVAADGGIFSFGDAPFYGSEGGKPLNSPIVAVAETPDGNGYWMVAADGGVFTFGDAPYLGAAATRHLNQSVIGIVATPDGKGYWLIGALGGVFNFGDAVFLGSPTTKPLNAPIVGAAS